MDNSLSQVVARFEKQYKEMGVRFVEMRSRYKEMGETLKEMQSLASEIHHRKTEHAIRSEILAEVQKTLGFG